MERIENFSSGAEDGVNPGRCPRCEKPGEYRSRCLQQRRAILFAFLIMLFVSYGKTTIQTKISLWFHISPTHMQVRTILTTTRKKILKKYVLFLFLQSKWHVFYKWEREICKRKYDLKTLYIKLYDSRKNVKYKS